MFVTKTVLVTIECDENITDRSLVHTVDQQLLDFGEGEYWDRINNKSLIGNITVTIQKPTIS